LSQQRSRVPGSCRLRPLGLRAAVEEIEGMDAVLPHDAGLVAILAVSPNTIGEGAYADDVKRVHESLKRLRPAVVALEVCRFRCEWHALQEFGLDGLREVKESKTLEDFERCFCALLRRGTRQASTTDEPLEDELQVNGSRKAELEAVRDYLQSEPEASVWLVDRDARRNQPRVEAWSSAMGAVGSATGLETPALLVAGSGFTPVTQTAAMLSPGNNTLRKRVIAEEREEYMVGELHRRLRQHSGICGTVVFLLGATQLQGLIRRWFEPPTHQRMLELDDDFGLSTLQSPDIFEIELRTQVSWRAVLESFEAYQGSPYIGDHEIVVTLEALHQCCNGELEARSKLLASAGFERLRSRVTTLPDKYRSRAEAALQALDGNAGV